MHDYAAQQLRLARQRELIAEAESERLATAALGAPPGEHRRGSPWSLIRRSRLK